MENSLRDVISGAGNLYEVKRTAPNQYHAESGDLCMNILCGCAAQYYEFEIDIQPQQQVTVKSTVPCGGCWGGLIGVQKNKEETARVREALQIGLANGRIQYESGGGYSTSAAQSKTRTQFVHEPAKVTMDRSTPSAAPAQYGSQPMRTTGTQGNVTSTMVTKLPDGSTKTVKTTIDKHGNQIIEETIGAPPPQPREATMERSTQAQAPVTVSRQHGYGPRETVTTSTDQRRKRTTERTIDVPPPQPPAEVVVERPRQIQRPTTAQSAPAHQPAPVMERSHPAPRPPTAMAQTAVTSTTVTKLPDGSTKTVKTSTDPYGHKIIEETINMPSAQPPPTDNVVRTVLPDGSVKTSRTYFDENGYKVVEETIEPYSGVTRVAY